MKALLAQALKSFLGEMFDKQSDYINDSLDHWVIFINRNGYVDVLIEGEAYEMEFRVKLTDNKPEICKESVVVIIYNPYTDEYINLSDMSLHLASEDIEYQQKIHNWIDEHIPEEIQEEIW